MDYRLVRSKRKTVSLSVDGEGNAVVRAPLLMPKWEIDRFVEKHAQWVEKRREYVKDQPDISQKREKELRLAAKQLMGGLTLKYGSIMGLCPTDVKITGAKTRFGSCSGRNSISYSWRLMLYPPEAAEYVAVHELAHIKHKNHSSSFYGLIAKVMPDYKERIKLLKLPPRDIYVQ